MKPTHIQCTPAVHALNRTLAEFDDKTGFRFEYCHSLDQLAGFCRDLGLEFEAQQFEQAKRNQTGKD